MAVHREEEEFKIKRRHFVFILSSILYDILKIINEIKRIPVKNRNQIVVINRTRRRTRLFYWNLKYRIIIIKISYIYFYERFRRELLRILFRSLCLV